MALERPKITDTNQALEALRGALFSKPGKEGWSILTHVLAAWSPDASPELGLDYVMEHLRGEQGDGWRAFFTDEGVVDFYGPLWPVLEGTVEADWALIPAGTYTIGSPESEVGRFGGEQLRRVILTDPFCIQTAPVLQGHWLYHMGYNPSNHRGTHKPVESVTWYDAVIYANTLSEAHGFEPCYTFRAKRGSPGIDCELDGVEFKGFHCDGYRLPTSAEWEVACRAGTQTATYNGDLQVTRGRSAVLDEIAWYGSNTGHVHVEDIKQKRPNPWGLYDMLGNASEWVWDRFDDFRPSEDTEADGTSQPPVVNPTGPKASLYCVARGGSSDESPDRLRAASVERVFCNDERDYTRGFRLARRAL